MTLTSKVAQAARKRTERPMPRILVVKDVWYLTPNMIRVVFAGPELDGFPSGRDGGNCKLMIPEIGETKEHFVERLSSGPPPVRRTYTVRKFDAFTQELSIDFVAHGDEGPASRWASSVRAEGFLGFAGPSEPKFIDFDADWYLLAVDPSAIPVAAVALEAMPRDAKGVAIFEITSALDQQEIDAPAGIEIHWLVHSDPHKASTRQEDLIKAIEWPQGRVKTCIAGESAVIRSLRDFLTNEKQVPREDTYISGYWKIGLIEDQHQKAKRDGAD